MYWSGSGIGNIFDVILGIERVKAAVTTVTVVFYLLNSAAQEPGVVKVRVYSDTDEFLGAADFEYKVTFSTVVCQVLQRSPDDLSELFALIRNHKRSSENQSSSAKQNSGESDLIMLYTLLI